MSVVRRTIALVNDLLMGWIHDRESISTSVDIELAAADRYMLELAKLKGVKVERRGRKKFIHYEPASDLRLVQIALKNAGSLVARKAEIKRLKAKLRQKGKAS